MFTGIIEDTGIIKNINRTSGNLNINIEPKTKNFLSDVETGDSIAVDGICLTVTKLTDTFFSVFVSSETFNITNLKSKKINSYVNLEKAMKLTDRFDGHIVQGHIDDTGRFIHLKKIINDYELQIQIPAQIKHYIVKKGSITINGISLTVADIMGANIKLAVIPETYNRTTLKYLKSGGDVVNIEIDLIAKYVENFVKLK